MDKEGYRPATIHEMFGYAKDNWNGKDWWAALGSVWVDSNGSRGVPYLYKLGSERGLFLDWDVPDLRWGEGCRFVAVSKSSSQVLDTRKLGSSDKSLGNFVSRAEFEEFKSKVEKLLKI